VVYITVGWSRRNVDPDQCGFAAVYTRALRQIMPD
jgi:hypothetical protein